MLKAHTPLLHLSLFLLSGACAVRAEGFFCSFFFFFTFLFLAALTIINLLSSNPELMPTAMRQAAAPLLAG